MRKATVMCQGVHPLLIHGMSRQQVLELGKFVAKADKAAATTDEACRRALYIDGEGYVILPVVNLVSCIVAAGQKVKLGSPPRQISTAETTNLFGYFDVQGGDNIRILDGDRQPILFPTNGEKPPWEEDVRRGVGKQAKVPTAICIVRPRFPQWHFQFECTYDERELSRVKFLELLQRAGRNGLGSFRPSKGRGHFGIWRPIVVDEVTLADREEGLVVTLDGVPVDLESKPIQEAAPKKGRKKEVAA